jgi:hypothetical protein
MKTPYRIIFQSNQSFKKGFKFMLSKGFVFTLNRYKNLESVEREITVDYWKIIFVGHVIECSMVMDAGCYIDDVWKSQPPDWVDISFPKFRREILPNY